VVDIDTGTPRRVRNFHAGAGIAPVRGAQGRVCPGMPREGAVEPHARQNHPGAEFVPPLVHRAPAVAVLKRRALLQVGS
jgi:hypothetical protein